MIRKKGASLLLAPYSFLWRGLRPFLKRNKRLAEGFAERLVSPGWPQSGDALEAEQGGVAPGQALNPVELWVQAASGGEAYLALELLKAIAGERAGREDPSLPLAVLCTSCTRQGMDVLRAGKAELGGSALDIQLRYFPLDQPELMRRAITLARPKLAALLETELWPGFLRACREASVPVFVLNGRMTAKSLKGYGLTKNLWKTLAPEKILAVSDEDAERFAALFGTEKTGRMPNMKFDRLQVAPLGGFSRPDGLPPVILLASVRKEEEGLLLAVLPELAAKAPQAAIVIAPRHMHRAEAWLKGLRACGLKAELRSALPGGRAKLDPEALSLTPGLVVVWDRFGELNSLYSLADAVFVGGSLRPLGGQNFLEPLALGLRPCIGPHWSNFKWAGSGLIKDGLVRELRDPSELPEALIENLASANAGKARTRELFAAYARNNSGGSRQAALAVLERLGR